MATKNPRTNVTFKEAELVLEVLEMREDFYLSKMAAKLDQEGVKTYRHDEVWRRFTV